MFSFRVGFPVTIGAFHKRFQHNVLKHQQPPTNPPTNQPALSLDFPLIEPDLLYFCNEYHQDQQEQPNAFSKSYKTYKNPS